MSDQNQHHLDENELAQMTENLNKSLTSEPINEDEIVHILNNTTNADRLIIREMYKRLYNHPIQNDISDKLSYKFKDLCICLFDSCYEYDARELHRAIHSFILFNEDKTICEILVTRPKWYLEIVDKVYEKFFGISLSQDIAKETSGDFKNYLTAILENERNEGQTISTEQAYDLAKQLYEKKAKNWGKDLEMFKTIFATKSREDLTLIARAYFELYQKNLYDAADDVSGDNRKLIKAVIFGVINPSEWFARKAFEAVQGLGTDTNTLNRVVVGRAEIDMPAIRDYYHMIRNKDIKDDVVDDTSGSYGKVMAALTQKF